MIEQPFDIATVMSHIREVMLRFPKPALFELAEQGYHSHFEQLTACIISIRTLDETTLFVARHLFERVRTPTEVSLLTPTELDELIDKCTFHEPKAHQIYAIARHVMQEYQVIAKTSLKNSTFHLSP